MCLCVQVHWSNHDDVCSWCWVCTSACVGAGIACWLEHLTRDRKVVSSNPWQERGENFLLQSQLCVLTLIQCLFQPHVTAVARKIPRSFCQKCKWQVTPKHAYTFDPTKSEWADYAAVQALCGKIRKRAHTQHFREHSVTVISAHWATVDWSWPEEWNYCAWASLHFKKKGCRQGMNSQNPHTWGKSHQACIWFFFFLSIERSLKGFELCGDQCYLMNSVYRKPIQKQQFRFLNRCTLCFCK